LGFFVGLDRRPVPPLGGNPIQSANSVKLFLREPLAKELSCEIVSNSPLATDMTGLSGAHLDYIFKDIK